MTANAPFLHRLLGEEAGRLATGVLVAHTPGVEGAGILRVECDRGPIVKVLARWLNLPPACASVSVAVAVRGDGQRQTWTRRFGESTTRTEQWIENGLLIESTGPARIGMRLTIEGDRLVYRSERVWFGPFRLPAWLGPQVLAEICGTDEGWSVQVTVRHAFFGLICRYSGNMEAE